MNDMDYVRYLAAMAQARVMLGKNLIVHRDFIHFEEKMRVKYGLPINSIYRDNILMTGAIRGSMQH